MYFKTLITILACNLLFILIAIPLILRRVPPNPVYGFRTRTTLADENIWYESNAYFGRNFVISSIISGIAVFCLIAPPLIVIILTLRYLRSLNNRS
jgi:uncharacterized membrane protein